MYCSPAVYIVIFILIDTTRYLLNTSFLFTGSNYATCFSSKVKDFVAAGKRVIHFITFFFST